MEIRKEVKTYLVMMSCPECKKGYMKPVGNIVLDTYPCQYPHRCDNCGFGENYFKTYPSTEYEYVEV